MSVETTEPTIENIDEESLEDAAWTKAYFAIPKEEVKPENRKFWTEEDIEELRRIGGPIVEAAYILSGARPKKYGVRIAHVGACKGTAMAVRTAMHRLGRHANYVEDESGTHGYVHLPRHEGELESPDKDPLILDPTYAQFMNAYIPDEETGELPDPFELSSKNNIAIGIKKGHHTEEHPYYIGPASKLKAKNSGRYVNEADPESSPWDDPKVLDEPSKL